MTKPDEIAPFFFSIVRCLSYFLDAKKLWLDLWDCRVWELPRFFVFHKKTAPAPVEKIKHDGQVPQPTRSRVKSVGEPD